MALLTIIIILSKTAQLSKIGSFLLFSLSSPLIPPSPCPLPHADMPALSSPYQILADIVPNYHPCVGIIFPTSGHPPHATASPFSPPTDRHGPVPTLLHHHPLMLSSSCCHPRFPIPIAASPHYSPQVDVPSPCLHPIPILPSLCHHPVLALPSLHIGSAIRGPTFSYF